MQQNIKTSSRDSIQKIITLGDKILVVVIVILAIISLVAVNRLRQPGQIVIIEVAGRMVQQLNLNDVREISVIGPIGTTRIKIAEHEVQVISSDCPEKLCIKTGTIRHAGEIIVCVPNKVVVKISGKRKTQFDVITQ